MTSPPLYGAPRPKSKTNAISLSSTSIHALSTELSLVRSRLSSSKSIAGRPRPRKPNLFTHTNKNVAQRAARDLLDPAPTTLPNLSEQELARSKKRLKEKARQYDAMKRGDLHADEGLVDFDRKWAEHPGSESDDGNEDEDEGEGESEDDEIIEYEDEFGRTRTGPKRLVEQAKRREAAAQRARAENANVNMRPEGLIVGNMIQTGAFSTATFSTVPSAEMISAALPKEELETHYDARKEVRTKGVGFYQFSTDVKERAAEMEALEKERVRTAEERGRAREKKKRRREAVEARKETVKRMRRRKVGGNWLEGFMEEIVGAGEGEKGE